MASQPQPRPRSTFRPPASIRQSTSQDTKHVSSPRLCKDGSVPPYEASGWKAIERLVQAQLEAVRESSAKLDEITRLLRSSAGVDVPSPLYVERKHDSQVKSALAEGEDVAQSTLTGTIPLEELIDMRLYESEFDQLRLHQETGPEIDEIDFETMSLSSEVDLVPDEYRSSRLPTPFDLPRPTTPEIPDSSPGPDAVRKRELRSRRKRPDYVHHPMDRYKRRRRMRRNSRPLTMIQLRQWESTGPPSPTTPQSTNMDKPQQVNGTDAEDDDDDEDEDRSVRGLSTAAVAILPASDGESRGIRWWRKGKNNLRGRLDEISCDMCRGRVHWACAGLDGDVDFGNDRWACPDCQSKMASDDPDHLLELAQQERCIRPDCIARTPLKRCSGDEAIFTVDSIVGRRVLHNRVNRIRKYEYLVRWSGYELFDCTWQEAKSFHRGVKDLEQEFWKRCQAEGLNDRARVVLLPETETCWDEEGDLKRDMLIELGVVPAEWWPEPKGKFTVKYA